MRLGRRFELARVACDTHGSASAPAAAAVVWPEALEAGYISRTHSTRGSPSDRRAQRRRPSVTDVFVWISYAARHARCARGRRHLARPRRRSAPSPCLQRRSAHTRAAHEHLDTGNLQCGQRAVHRHHDQCAKRAGQSACRRRAVVAPNAQPTSQNTVATGHDRLLSLRPRGPTYNSKTSASRGPAPAASRSGAGCARAARGRDEPGPGREKKADALTARRGRRPSSRSFSPNSRPRQGPAPRP